MSDTSSRRRLLALIGAGAVTAAAGCLGDDDEPTDEEMAEADDEPTGDDSLGGGDDAGTTDDGQDDGPGDDAADDADGTQESDPDDDGTDDSDGSQTFSEVVDEDVISENISYQLDFEDTGEEPATGTQLVYGEDMHITIEDEVMGTIELYEVDGEIYSVLGGDDCLKGGELTGDDPTDFQYDDASVEETTTIDGEEVYVFEDGDETLYVSTTTGYLTRLEGPDFVADFHSWGEVDPIEPPDMECDDGL